MVDAKFNQYDEENDMDGDDERKYLQACKTVEYVWVDGQPGLI